MIYTYLLIRIPCYYPLVGLWPLTVTFEVPIIQHPSHWASSFDWFSFVVAMILQLSSLIVTACVRQQSEKIADPRLEPRSKRRCQLTIRGMISTVIIAAITASTVANGASSTENTLLCRLMTIIDEDFQFYR